ncbi:MAG: LamG-like jellyroll fold domain-containing protein [Oceanococcus sp.]
MKLLVSNSNHLVLLVALALSACSSGENNANALPQYRTVQGAVVKAPVSGASIEIAAIDRAGQPLSPAVATVTSDANGGFSIPNLPQGAYLARSRGGRFSDESDPSGQRVVELTNQQGFETLIPVGATTATLNPFTQILVDKLRTQAAQDDVPFNSLIEGGRDVFQAAFGFDVLTTIPDNPIAPQPGTQTPKETDETNYAMALGGFAQAVNAIAVSLGEPQARFDIIRQYIRDLGDGIEDGNAKVALSINGVPLPIARINEEINRFRNNNDTAYFNIPAFAIKLLRLTDPAARDPNIVDPTPSPTVTPTPTPPAETAIPSPTPTPPVESATPSPTPTGESSPSPSPTPVANPTPLVSPNPEPPANRAPVAKNDLYSIDRGDSFSGNVLNNNGFGRDSDADNDPLTAILVSDPAFHTEQFQETASTTFTDKNIVAVEECYRGGQPIDLSNNGSFFYEHDFCDHTSDSFSYKVNDGEVDSNVATVTINIIPTGVGDSFILNNLGDLLTGNVLDNDLDDPADTLTATLSTSPLNASSFALNSDGNFTYQHDAAKPGGDSFTYLVSDDYEQSTTAVTVNILFTPTCIAPPTGMVAWFSGDTEHSNSTNDVVYDLISSNHANSFESATTALTAGVVAEAMNFGNQDSSFVTQGSFANVEYPAFTIDAWIKLNSLPTSNVPILVANPLQSAPYEFFIDNAGKLNLTVRGDTNRTGTSAATLAANEFVHVAVSYDDNDASPTMRFYINGVLDASIVGSSVSLDFGNGEWHIGGIENEGSDPSINGIVDELEIFERALASSEILSIFNAGTAGKCKPILLANLKAPNGSLLDSNANVSAELARSTADAGDFNGDGYDDIIVGERGVNSAAGVSYIVFGSASGIPSIGDLNSSFSGSTYLPILGETPGDESGVGVAGIGDVNGDGLDDVLISAHKATTANGSGSGKAYVVFGRTPTPSSINLGDLNPDNGGDGSQGFEILGSQAFENLGGGFSNESRGRPVAAAGDFNNDGLDDFLIGARDANYGAGHAYLIYGSTNFTARFDLANIAPAIPSKSEISGGFVVIGDFDQELGTTVAGLGDINGDGFDDIGVGAPATISSSLSGAAYVLFGAPANTLPKNRSLASTPLVGTDGFKVTLGENEDQLGMSISSAGRFNGSSVDGVLIGAPGVTRDGTSFQGEAYLLFGSTTKSFGNNLGVVDLSASDADIVFKSFLDIGNVGDSVFGPGDVDRDGFDDVVIGAPGSFVAGRSMLVFGEAEPPASIDLKSLDYTTGRVFVGDAQINADVGKNLHGGGDVNGDGYPDMLLGARAAKPDGFIQQGQGYVVNGKDFRKQITLLGSSGPDTPLDGTSSADKIDGLAGADTLNGLGSNDILIGGQGNEAFMDGGDGNDILIGAQGDDNLLFNPAQDLRLIDGGTGFDNVFPSIGANIDLSDLHINHGYGLIRNIEAFDLDDDSSSNTLKVNAVDVYAVTGVNVNAANVLFIFLGPEDFLQSDDPWDLVGTAGGFDKYVYDNATLQVTEGSDGQFTRPSLPE